MPYTFRLPFLVAAFLSSIASAYSADFDIQVSTSENLQDFTVVAIVEGTEGEQERLRFNNDKMISVTGRHVWAALRNCILSKNGRRVSCKRAASIRVRQYGSGIGRATTDSNGNPAVTTFPRASGTAFVINNQGYALTSAHLVDGCDRIEAKIDGRYETLRVEYSSKWEPWPESNYVNERRITKYLDVAIIRSYALRNAFKPLTFSRDPLRNLDNVIVAGYPLNNRVVSSQIKLSKGEVVSSDGPNDDIRLFQHAASTQPGSSGGPILNTKGNVVGLVKSKLQGASVELVNFGVKAKYIAKFLGEKYVSFEAAGDNQSPQTQGVVSRAEDSVFSVQCY